jgi:DNA-directed RNA polymerase specialized sigma24 family protein
VTSQPGELEELALYEGLRRGSGRAFRGLVELHQAALLRVAGWYVQDPAEGELLVRRAWGIALDGLNMFTWQTTLRAWLFGILVSLGRGERTRPQPPGEAGDGAGVQGAGSFDWEHLPWAPEWTPAAGQVLEEALDALPLPELEAVRFRDLERWSLRDTCDVLGLTRAEAQRVLHNGRLRLVQRVGLHLGVAGCGSCEQPGVRATEYLEDGLAPAAREEFERHAAGCAVCRCRVARMRGLVAALALLAPPASAGAPDRELMLAFRRWRAGRGLRLWHRLRPRRRGCATL